MSLSKISMGKLDAGVNPEKIKQQILNFDEFNLNSEIKTTISHRVIGGKVIEDDIKLISRVIS